MLLFHKKNQKKILKLNQHQLKEQQQVACQDTKYLKKLEISQQKSILERPIKVKKHQEFKKVGWRMGNVTAVSGNNVNPSQKEQHKTLQKYTANDGLTFVQMQNIEGIQQKCKLFQKKGSEILFSVPIRKSDYQASQIYNQDIKVQFNDRVKLQHTNLISCLGIDNLPTPPQQNQEVSLGNGNNNSSLLGNQQQEEDSNNVLNLMYEYNTFSLEALISERLDSNRLFPEDDLLNLAKSILNILNYLQRQSIPHGDIHPSSIFFNTAGNNFAIYDRDFLCGRCIGMRLAESGKKFSYLSPEQITLMRSGSNVFTSNEMIYKADIFCLGMTLLEAASLRLSQECYDENYSILAPVISERIQFIQNYYSPQFCSYLSLMLEYDVRKRLDPVSLWNKLQRDTSFALPAHIQNSMLVNQQQQQQQQQNNQRSNVPQFGGEQQRAPANQKQQQPQINNQNHQQSLLYQQSVHQQSLSQSIEDYYDHEQSINQNMSKLNIQENDMSQYGHDQQINVQDSAHFRVSLQQSQIQLNPNQNNQQRIQVLAGNQVRNMAKQPQQQHQIQQQQQFQQLDHNNSNLMMRNSQFVQQQVPFQGVSQLHNQQNLNNNQQRVPLQQNEIHLQQQQRNRMIQQQQQQVQQQQNLMQSPQYQYQQGLQPKTIPSQQQLDYIPQQDYQQQNQQKIAQGQQYIHPQQQHQQMQQIQKVQMIGPSHAGQIPNKERSASSYSVSQEKIHPQEINQTQTHLVYNPHQDNLNLQGSDLDLQSKLQPNQRQGMQRSMIVNQSRKHSMSVFNGNNAQDSPPQQDYNPSQILKNLQEQQQEIHAQYKQHFGNEQSSKKQTSPNQQNQREFINNSQLFKNHHHNNQNISQEKQNSQQHSNPTLFETQDMETIAPENDPNTSTNMIVQSQNAIKFKHPRQSQQPHDQNTPIHILGNNSQFPLKQVTQIQNVSPNPLVSKQEQMFLPNQFIASAGVSPLRENNGKSASSNATQKPNPNPSQQRFDKDSQVIQSMNIGSALPTFQQPQQNRAYPQRSQSFIQYISNPQQIINQTNGLSQNDIEDNSNQNIRLQQSPQMIIRQPQSTQNPIANQSYIQIIDQPVGQSSEQPIPYQIVYQPSQQIEGLNQAISQPQLQQQYQYQQPNQVIQPQILNQQILPQQILIPQNQLLVNQPMRQQVIGQNFGKNPNLVLLNSEQEQQLPEGEKIQVITQVISPTAFKNISPDSKDQQEYEFIEQPKKAAATTTTTGSSSSQILSQQPQYYLSPIPTNNNARYSDFQTSTSQQFSTSTKKVLGVNNRASLIGNSNQQSQSVVMDTSQHDISQQHTADTSVLNNRRILQNQNQNTPLESYSSPSYKIQGEINTLKSPAQNLITASSSYSLLNENKKLPQSNSMVATQQQGTANKQENGNDPNQQNLSPNSQPAAAASALKLSLLLNNQLKNNLQNVNGAKPQESQTQQVSSYQPSIDLNERVKQVIARSQAIRKTFE